MLHHRTSPPAQPAVTIQHHTSLRAPQVRAAQQPRATSLDTPQALSREELPVRLAVTWDGSPPRQTSRVNYFCQVYLCCNVQSAATKQTVHELPLHSLHSTTGPDVRPARQDDLLVSGSALVAHHGTAALHMPQNQTGCDDIALPQTAQVSNHLIHNSLRLLEEHPKELWGEVRTKSSADGWTTLPQRNLAQSQVK